MKNFFRVIIILAGFAIGPGLVMLVYSFMRTYFDLNPALALLPGVNMLIYIVSSLVCGIIFIFISKSIINGFVELTAKFEARISALSGRAIVAGACGLVLGLFVAYLFSDIIFSLSIVLITVPISVLLYVFCAYLGMRAGGLCAKKFSKQKKGGAVRANILDTSVIIDGRIFDICKTKVIDGKIVIPSFVLDELRHIADSSDSLKRSKGRRGLDILNKIRKELDIPVEVVDKNYEDAPEVDAKLLKMAGELEGRIVTNDYNLNKVAAVKGVSVLNINDLANAIKPVLVAGEELRVTVLKEGKEYDQGVAYLEDGTMIVVENGRHLIGEEIEVTVTSILQTSAGRMIFAKPA